MRNSVVIGSAFVAKYPTGGGNFWVPLQYLLGFAELGVDAHWLEVVWGEGDPQRARAFVDTFRRAVDAVGVADRVTVVFYPDHGVNDPPGRVEYLGLSADALRARARDSALLNMANSLPAA